MAKIVFNQQISTAATKVLEANLNVFNTASRGALVIGAGDFLGDYLERVMWAAQQMVNRRNAYGTGDVTATELEQILERAIKIDQRVGPLKVTSAIMDRLGKNDTEAAAVMGTQVAQQLIQDYINVATGTIVAATPSQLNYDFTTSGGSVVNLRGVSKSLRLMGDAYQRILVHIMSGASYNDLVVEGTMQNAEQLFTIDGVKIMQTPLGQTILVTDAPALDSVTGSGAAAKAKYRVLSLQAGAAVIQTREMHTEQQTILGKENIQHLIQGETGFNIGLKGYTYVGKAAALGTGDKPTSPTDVAEQKADASGSASPTDATLYAATSWKVTDTRWKPATESGKTGFVGGTLDAVKGLAGVIATFGDA